MFTEDPASVILGGEILPFEMGYLPAFYQKKAEVELHDTAERRMLSLRQLKDIAKNDKHLKHVEFDDDILLQYLRCRKFNVQRALSQLKAFCSIKKRYKECFTGFRFDNIVKTMDNKFVTVLPWRCKDGCAIILVELDNWIPSEFPIEDFRRMVVILLCQSLRDPMTQVNGFKAIVDVRSNPIRHLRYITPQNLYLLVHGTQECIPGRYKEVHIVNQSLTFKAAWFIIKTLLSDKLKKRIHFHNNSETLLNFFPKKVLPEQYGGDLKDYAMTDWLKSVMEPEKLSTIGGTAKSVEVE